jgi:hypothetical protein
LVILTYGKSWGFHITPVHYFQPIPDTRKLKESLWKCGSKLIGVELNTESQLNFVDNIFPKFKQEYSSFPINNGEKATNEFVLDNDAFAFVDAYVLYCMVRYFRPAQIIEIGSGVSTLISAKACLRNEEDGVLPELTAIEPYPNEVLRKGFPGLSNVIQEEVENLEFEIFEKLNENDILFIDFSHVVKTGGDVIYEYLEILPRLKKGVIVHSHDIFLPLHYPQEWVVNKHWFFTEQYLLQAFLMYNRAWEVLWAGNFMHLNYPEKLEQAFPHYDRKTYWPGSFYMRKQV